MEEDNNLKDVAGESVVQEAAKQHRSAKVARPSESVQEDVVAESGITGLWQINEHTVPAQFFYKLEEVDGHVDGQGRSKDSEDWQSKVEGRFDGSEELEWTEYMNGEIVGSFQCSVRNGQIHSGIGTLINGTSLEFDGAKVETEYIVSFSGLQVTETFVHTSKQKILLARGSRVIVMEFAKEADEGRVRARIKSPAGWITAWMSDKSESFIKLVGTATNDKEAKCELSPFEDADDEDAVTVLFQPGALGFKHNDGSSISVIAPGSQAQNVGLQLGWTIQAVEKQTCTSFNDDVFKNAKVSNKPYHVTFKKTPPVPKQKKKNTESGPSKASGHEKAKRGPPPVEGDEETVTVLFQPGSLGFKHNDGSSISVIADESQAQKVGLQLGWTIQAVENEICTSFFDDAFKNAKAGNKPYRVTFKKTAPVPKQKKMKIKKEPG